MLPFGENRGAALPREGARRRRGAHSSGGSDRLRVVSATVTSGRATLTRTPRGRSATHVDAVLVELAIQRHQPHWSCRAAFVLFQLVAVSARSRLSRSAGRRPEGRPELPHHLGRHVDDARGPGARCTSRRLDDVAQLADVPGPGVAQQRARAPRGVEPRLERAGSRSNSREEVVDEQRDVLAPLAQRRQLRRGPRSAGSRGPRGSALAVGRARRSRLVAATTRTSTAIGRARRRRAGTRRALEHAQELGLQRRRHARRSRRGTACRRAAQLEQPGLRAVGAGERAALVAEQLALEQGLGDGARS